MIAFELDVAMTMFGYWKGGLVSKYVFMGLFVVAMIMVLKVIPQSFNASAKARFPTDTTVRILKTVMIRIMVNLKRMECLTFVMFYSTSNL